MPTMLDRFAEHAATHPGKPFLVAWEDESYAIMTYGDLHLEARAMAAALAIHAREGVVFIVLEPTVDLYPTFLGCMLAGLIPSFLPFPTPKQDPVLYFSSHKALFARTRPACVVTYAGLVEALRDVLPPGTPLLDIAALRGQGPRPDVSFAPRSPAATALLQFSSGTTGLKKGVSLSFAQIDEQVSAYAPVADLSSASIVVSWLPLYHDMGLFTGFLIPLSLGASVVTMNPFDWVRRPALFLRLVQTFLGTHAWLPNFAFQHILATTDPDARFDLTSMRQLVSCSEVVKPNVLTRFVERFARDGLDATKLRACYAMAEASFAVSQSRVGAVTSRFASADLDVGRRPRVLEEGTNELGVALACNGPAIAGIEIAIAGPLERQTGPTTAVGEIVLRGSFLFSGYFGTPDVSAAAIRAGWYHTGDVGFLHAGNLFICGRLKELIIVHGRNHYCHDIEAIASDVPGVVPGRVVAIGEEVDSSASEELLLIVELESEDPALHEPTRRALKKTVFAHLELTPRRIEFVPKGWLVKTTSGKLSRSENLGRLRRVRQEEQTWAKKRAS